MRKLKPISTSSEWTFELIQRYDLEIARLAHDFKLDTYPNQIEKIYKRGTMGLAYELVINSNPCISYLMEENTMAMQALVIAHACYGHNSFFKSNYLFKMWTDADAIIDYLVFARDYISDCEERYGLDAVEEILDACHALRNYAVDRYKHPQPLSLKDEKARQKQRAQYMQAGLNEIWRTIPSHPKPKTPTNERFPSEPQENILAFIEQHAPLLKPWQREIICIVRTIAQYFYPQRQTKVMNEGWACFWHYTLLNALYDEKRVTDEFMMEILQVHTNVIMQPAYNSPQYTGINPYTLGYHMMQDIKRICEKPTEEDKQWFPYLANTNWQDSLNHAMRHFKDESFIAQYLSPHLIRELKLFQVTDHDNQSELFVDGIHNEQGYQLIRETLSKQYDLGTLEPDIQVYSVDLDGDRSLTLHYTQNNR